MPDTKRFSSSLRATLVAAAALSAVAVSSAAYADSGSISFRVVKAGFVVGGSGGDGTLTFQGKRYSLGIGGISYGFTDRPPSSGPVGMLV